MAQGWRPTQKTQEAMGGALDILGSLAINFGASQWAASDPKLRWIPFGKTDNAFMDGRLLGGIAAGMVGVFGQQLVGGGATGEMVGRVATDTAHGLLGSFIATERVRAACLARMAQAAAAATQPQFATTPGMPSMAPALLTETPTFIPPPPAGLPEAAVVEAAGAARRMGPRRHMPQAPVSGMYGYR